MLVMGIDPGTNITGYGIVDERYRVLDFGCIRPPRKASSEEKRKVIFESLGMLMDKYGPDVVAVETQYVKHNVRTALILGKACGAAELAATIREIPVFEYAPTRVKKAVCHGRASKEQVQAMVQRLLSLRDVPPEDAADALAIAICHHHERTNV